MSAPNAYLDWTPVPRVAINLPLPLPPPDGFEPGELATWPVVNGRVEFVGGRLLYMPPCGDEQQDTVADLVLELGAWTRRVPGFTVASNEAGIMLGPDVRGADAAIWRRESAGPYTGGFRKSPPLLAVEVAGKDEPAEELLNKADWYLRHGVEVVWIPGPRDANGHREDPGRPARCQGRRTGASASVAPRARAARRRLVPAGLRRLTVDFDRQPRLRPLDGRALPPRAVIQARL